MYFTRIHSMKYLLPTYILFLGFATSEFCIDSANQLCPLALEKYPLKQPDTNFCKRLDVFQHCFDAIFPNCNDYFHNVHAIRCKDKRPPPKAVSRTSICGATSLAILLILFILILV